MKKALSLLTLLISTSHSFCMQKQPILLHQVASQGLIYRAQLLLERDGIQVDVRDETGKTPLHYAAQSGNYLMVKLLLDHGAQINAQDTDGRTALHLAVLFGKGETVKLLVDRGASLTLQSNNGNTPLHLAALYNITTLVLFLLSHGAPINIENEKGKTPLHMATKLETLKMLLFYNRNVPVVAPPTKDRQKMSSLKDRCLIYIYKYLAVEKLTKKDIDKVPDDLKHEITKSIKLAYMKHVLYALGRGGVRPLYLEAKNQVASITAFINQVLKAKKLDDLKALGYQEY